MEETRSTVMVLDNGSEARYERARLLIEGGPDRGREMVMPDRPVVIGRAREADLRLEDAAVSREHAVIRPNGRDWKLQDLGSRSGTYVNGIRVEAVILGDGARIKVGESDLVFRLDQAVLKAPAKEADEFEGLVTDSPRMRKLFGLIEKLGALDLPLLLVGEPGTGKEALARAVHRNGPYPSGPYEVVDCTLLGDEHMRSELFGHVKGAFTGATDDRTGAFERADGGTLFLDEIGELPLDLQPALLRILEQGEVRPLGGDTARRVRVRVVSATNRDLRAMAKEGTFRPDLYHRLSALEVAVPPLRERDDDLFLLAEGFLPAGVELGEGARGLMRTYPWPGNVRELKNRMIRGGALAEGGVVRADDLGLEVDDLPGGVDGAEAPGDGAAVPRSLEDWTEHAVRIAMRRHDGNRKAVAEELGISRTTLYRYLKKIEG